MRGGLRNQNDDVKILNCACYWFHEISGELRLQSSCNSATSRPSGWTRSTAGATKINRDAAFNGANDEARISALVRNNKRKIFGWNQRTSEL
ncbi:hypothetical protein V6N13_018784 [Hibiscus sabdariffa]